MRDPKVRTARQPSENGKSSKLHSRSGETESQKQPGDRARAASRAFDILEYFRSRSKPARTTQIARALGIPLSSADDLLKVMVGRSYLSYDTRTRFYSPSYRLLRIADDLVSRYSSLQRVREIEGTLHSRTGQTVLVTVQEGSMFRIVSVVAGSWRNAQTNISDPIPLARYAEDSGWRPTSNFATALLAGNSDAEIVELLRGLDEPGRHFNYLPVIKAVRDVRKRGFAECAYNLRVNSRSTASYAKLLCQSDHMPAIAIGCVGYAEEVTPWRRYFEGSGATLGVNWNLAV
jgi:DNA-binding IclR family transcriptional regulator